MVITQVLNKQLINTSKIVDVLISLLIIIGSFLVPTFLAKLIPLGKYQQILIGTIVNTSLILTAIYTKGTFKTLSIVTLPSISTILGGILFTEITAYSKIMIPSIWFGNFTLIFLYKWLFVNKKYNYIISAFLAIIVKVSIIYFSFVLMTKTMQIPEIAKQTLNISMGITQLITAISASVIVFFITYYIKKKNINNSRV